MRSWFNTQTLTVRLLAWTALLLLPLPALAGDYDRSGAPRSAALPLLYDPLREYRGRDYPARQRASRDNSLPDNSPARNDAPKDDIDPPGRNKRGSAQPAVEGAPREKPLLDNYVFNRNRSVPVNDDGASCNKPARSDDAPTDGPSQRERSAVVNYNQPGELTLPTPGILPEGAPTAASETVVAQPSPGIIRRETPGDWPSMTDPTGRFLPASDARLSMAHGDGLGNPVEVFESYESSGLDGVPAPVCSSGCQLNSNRWFAESDVLYWHHSQADGKVLAQDLGILGIQQFKASDAPFGWEPAGAFTLGHSLGHDCQNRDHDIEFTYIGQFQWEGDAAITSQARIGLFTPENQRFPGFNFADTIHTHLESEFESFELNWRIRTRLGRDKMVMNPDGCWQRECTPNFTYSLFGGLCFMPIDERFIYRSRITTLSDAVFRGNYDTFTKNYIFGPQIGGDCVEQHCNWSWGVRGKVGLMCDDASATRIVEGVDEVALLSTIAFNNKQRDQLLGFMGQVGLKATYNLSPNAILHAGYDFLLLTDVAQAPQQVKFQRNIEGVEFGSLILHGISLGFEYQW